MYFNNSIANLILKITGLSKKNYQGCAAPAGGGLGMGFPADPAPALTSGWSDKWPQRVIRETVDLLLQIPICKLGTYISLIARLTYILRLPWKMRAFSFKSFGVLELLPLSSCLKVKPPLKPTNTLLTRQQSLHTSFWQDSSGSLHMPRTSGKKDWSPVTLWNLLRDNSTSKKYTWQLWNHECFNIWFPSVSL